MDPVGAPYERQVKGALRKGKLGEPFLASRFSFSPYMACGHGCAYCDGRAERYWVDGVFDRDVVARTNVAAVLEREVGKLRERAVVSVGSGISDAYQPVERRHGLMRQCAEVLLRHGLPVSILTKSARVGRDLDLWSQVARGAGFNLFVSLVFHRDEERQVFEPGASSVEERLEAIRVFKAAGCGVGVYAMPLLPWISDTPESVERLLDRCREAGADFVFPGGLTLRPGRQKEFFLARLGQWRPDLTQSYRDLYGENRPSGSGRRVYSRALGARLRDALARFGLPARVPHRLYRGRMPLYDELHVLLCHMVDLYGDRGMDVSRLVAGLNAYRVWIVARKTLFNRRRSMTQEQLEEELRWALREGDLAQTVANQKLLGFMRAVVLDRRVFDYVRLELGEEGP